MVDLRGFASRAAEECPGRVTVEGEAEGARVWRGDADTINYPSQGEMEFQRGTESVEWPEMDQTAGGRGDGWD